MTPENMYTYTIFIESDLIYSHQGKWGWVPTIFSFIGIDLQKIIEMYSYIQYMPHIFGIEFLFDNLAICCVTEKF